MRVQEEARRKAEEVSAVTTGALAPCALLITAVTKEYSDELFDEVL